MPDMPVTPVHAEAPIFVVGGDSMLGRGLVAALEGQGKTVWQSTRNRSTTAGRRVFLDLASDTRDLPLPFSGAGTAILCAACTSIQQCEREPTATRRINVDNTVALAKKLLDAGIATLFLSSNTVFDGMTAFAKAGDSPHPQHEYGRQKAQAEEELLRLGSRCAVIRFSKIVDPEMALARDWIGKLRAGRAIYPFHDAVMAPVPAAFAVDLICRMAAHQRAGITQACAAHDISYAEAAKYLAAKLALNLDLVQPVSWRDAGLPAFPLHTTLDTRGLKQLALDAPSPLLALDQFR